MPHTNRKPKAPPAFAPAKFVNITLSKEQLSAVKAESWDMSMTDNVLNKLLSDGYKVTMRYDDRNDCFACWLIPSAGSENAGYILAGRGSTPSKAIKQLAFLHFKVFDEVWGSEDQSHVSELDD